MSRSETPSVLLFVPARDEAASIQQVIEENRDALARLGYAPDVLVIDDGSHDTTAKLARACGASVIHHPAGQGLGASFREATQHAIRGGYAAMLTVDADGQFTAADVPALAAPVLAGDFDFATGSRFLPGSRVEAMPRSKRWGNHMMSLLVGWILGRRYSDVSCGFRIYNREALLRLHLSGTFTYTQEVFLNLAYKRIRITEVPIQVRYFRDRRSRIANNLFNYTWRTSKIIFKCLIYYAPLRLFGFLAMFLFVIAAPVIAALGARYFAYGLITPFKGIGITALAVFSLAFLSASVGIILQIVSRLQLTAEEVLYYAKRYER